MIYADNAATTKLDSNAFMAMKPFLLEEYGNASQPYTFSRSAKAAIKQAREIIASCINADPDEIYFTSGGTEGDNWAIKGLACSDADYNGIITSLIEHHAVLNACSALERKHYSVVYLKPTEDGIIEPSKLQSVINNKTRLVSIMLVNNEIGTIQPIKDLCDVAHTYGAVFHTDAVQASGHIPVDVQELGVDILSASAHKFNGPKGIGFMYVRRGTKIIPFFDGGAQENGFRAGTENIASIVGMAVALKNNCEEIEANTEHLNKLDKIIVNLLDRSGVNYRRNGGNRRVPGNISLSFNNADGESLLHRLDLMGICISTGSACDSVNTQVSHVLRAINLPIEYAQGTIRITLGKDNSQEDAISIANALVHIVKG